MFFINHALEFKYQPSHLDFQGSTVTNNTVVPVIRLRYVIIVHLTDVFISVYDTTDTVFILLQESLLNIFSLPIIMQPVSDCCAEGNHRYSYAV